MAELAFQMKFNISMMKQLNPTTTAGVGGIKCGFDEQSREQFYQQCEMESKQPGQEDGGQSMKICNKRNLRPLIRNQDGVQLRPMCIENISQIQTDRFKSYPSLNQYHWLCSRYPIPECHCILTKQKKFIIPHLLYSYISFSSYAQSSYPCFYLAEFVGQYFLELPIIILNSYQQLQTMKNSDEVSQEQLNEEINDKLNELWTGMNDKRKKLVRNMTPGYSRRTDQSELNQSSNNYATENHLFKMREKLASEVSAGKHKDLEIENLKKAVAQLTNDKKMLVYELQQVYGPNNENMNSSLLNQSSIQNSKLEINKNTANFQSIKKKKKNKNFATIEEQTNKSKQQEVEHQNQPVADMGNLQNLPKSRLVQLLRSTAQYREFIYYYDSHELSYLKRLQEQHRKNCDHTASVREKAYWAPTEILQEMRRLNKKQKWGLTEPQSQSVISMMKAYYERNLQEKLKKAKDEYDMKLKKHQRQSQYGIPYDLVQVCKAKQRQLSKLGKRSKTNSFK